MDTGHEWDRRTVEMQSRRRSPSHSLPICQGTVPETETIGVERRWYGAERGRALRAPRAAPCSGVGTATAPAAHPFPGPDPEPGPDLGPGDTVSTRARSHVARCDCESVPAGGGAGRLTDRLWLVECIDCRRSCRDWVRAVLRQCWCQRRTCLLPVCVQK